MTGDVKAQATEVLRGNDFGLLPDRGGGMRHGLDRQVARAAVDALAEAGLLADERWQPLSEMIYCTKGRVSTVHFIHEDCEGGSHRPLAVAVETAAPQPESEEHYGEGGIPEWTI